MYESQRSWDSEDEVMLPREVEVDGVSPASRGSRFDSKSKARRTSLPAQRENKLASGEKSEFQGKGDGLELEKPEFTCFYW